MCQHLLWIRSDLQAIYKPCTTISKSFWFFLPPHPLSPLRFHSIFSPQVHQIGSRNDHYACGHDDKHDRRYPIVRGRRQRSKEPSGKYATRLRHTGTHAHGRCMSDIQGTVVCQPCDECWCHTICSRDAGKECPIADTA